MRPVPTRFPPSIISACCYLLVWAATLADQILAQPVLGDIAGLALLLFLLLEFRNQQRYAQVLFAGTVGIGLIGIACAADPLALFLDSWRRGATYASFFLALSSLRDAAETSPLVRRCGQHLVAQPPGRRYAALTAGGHVFAIILSYGAIDLLGAMVTRANAPDAAAVPPQVQAIRSRRMLMAIFRGFALMNCWNPLNLMSAVVLTAVPGAPMRALLPIALLVSIGMAAIGWLEDRMFAAGLTVRAATRPQTQERWTIHLRIVALVVLVMALADGVSQLAGIPLVAGITFVVPMIGLGWVVVQTRRIAGRRPLLALGMLGRRGARFLRRVPGFRGEATVLGGAGFMGLALSGALPPDGFAAQLAFLPPIAIPLLVPPLLIATGQLGLSPVAIVALMGAAIPQVSLLGVPPAALAFACMLSWGLATNMTPMSASAITTARWVGVSPWTICTRWNVRFTFAAALLAWAAIAAVFVFWPRG